MSMDQAQFVALVNRMEQLAREAPSAYKRRVFALAALGYGYLVLVGLVLVLLLAGALWTIRYSAYAGGKLFIVFGALLLVVLRATWVRLQPPAGKRLSRSDAPQLFDLLDQLRARLDTPPVHEVLVTPEFNAAVTQVPRLGLFGWHRNYLLIGLPLMKGLTVPQFEAVLAHELGHLSRGHARAGNWIYRLRLVWYRLESALEQNEQWGAAPIRAFFRWYIPYFNACSFPLARHNEFEADACSVQLTSARSAAQALTNVNVMASYLREQYWPTIHASARETAQPAFAPYSGLSTAKLQQTGVPHAQRWLDEALARSTTYDDTHPALKDRLAAMGMKAELALPAAGEAADQLLGATAVRLQSQLDAEWRQEIENSWKQAYQATQKKRERRAGLREQGSQLALDTDEVIELANLEEDVGSGASTALALRRDLVARAPDSVVARYYLARQLLSQGEREGVALMESVIRADADAIVPGSEILRDYWWQQGEREQARRWHERAVERSRVLQGAEAERQGVQLSDAFLPHGLAHEALASLVAQLKQVKGLRRAYLVRKAVEYLPEQPLYILGFRVAVLGFFMKKRAQAVLEALRTNIDFPGEALILNVEGNNSRFGRKFRRCRKSRII